MTATSTAEGEVTWEVPSVGSYGAGEVAPGRGRRQLYRDPGVRAHRLVRAHSSHPRKGAPAITSTVADHARRGAAFLVIGGLAFLVDAATFNVLVYWGGRGPMFELPILAKIIAIVLASIATYLGNHWWTFRDRKNRPSVRQILVFALINGGAIVLQLGCLGFSRYVLGLADPVADNVSGTLIGQALATIFRYVMYDRFVFPEQREPSHEDER